jgi:hypothetical protein
MGLLDPQECNDDNSKNNTDSPPEDEASSKEIHKDGQHNSKNIADSPPKDEASSKEKDDNTDTHHALHTSKTDATNNSST